MMFHYSNYWGTWSRILAQDGMWTYELNITSVGGWKATQRETIRCHCTGMSNRDKHTFKLPDDVMAKLVANVGQELATKLTTYDYLQDITLKDIMSANQKTNGGGAPLEHILNVKSGQKVFWTN